MTRDYLHRKLKQANSQIDKLIEREAEYRSHIAELNYIIYQLRKELEKLPRKEGRNAA